MFKVIGDLGIHAKAIAVIAFALTASNAHAWSPTQYTTSAEDEVPPEIATPSPQIEAPAPESSKAADGTESTCPAASTANLQDVQGSVNQLGNTLGTLSHPFPNSCYSAVCSKASRATAASPSNFTGLLSSGLQRALKQEPRLNCSSPSESSKESIDGYLAAYSTALRGDTCSLLTGAINQPKSLVPTLNYLEGSERETASACYSSRPARANGSKSVAPELPADLKQSRLLTDSVRQLLRLRTQIDETEKVIQGKAQQCDLFRGHAAKSGASPSDALDNATQLQTEAALCFNVEAAKEKHKTLVRQFVTFRDGRFGDKGRETPELMAALQSCGPGSELGTLLVAMLKNTGGKFSKLDAAWKTLAKAQTSASGSYKQLATVIQKADLARRKDYRQQLKTSLDACMKFSRDAMNSYRKNRGVLVRTFEWTNKKFFDGDVQSSFEESAAASERLYNMSSGFLSSDDPSYEDLVKAQRGAKAICQGAKIDGVIIQQYLESATSGGKAVFTIVGSPIVAVGVVLSGGSLIAAAGAEGATATTVLTGMAVGAAQGAAFGAGIGVIGTAVDNLAKADWKAWDADLLKGAGGGALNGAIYGTIGGAVFGGAGALETAAARSAAQTGAQTAELGFFEKASERLFHNAAPAAGAGAASGAVVKVKDNLLAGRDAFDGVLSEAAFGATVFTVGRVASNGVMGVNPATRAGRLAGAACEVGTMGACSGANLLEPSTIVNIASGGIGANRKPGSVEEPVLTTTSRAPEVPEPVQGPEAPPQIRYRQDYNDTKARAEGTVGKDGKPRAPLPLKEAEVAPVVIENPATGEKVKAGTAITIKSGETNAGSLSWDPEPADPSGKTFIPSLQIPKATQGREISRLLLAKALEKHPETENISGVLEEDNRQALKDGYAHATAEGLKGSQALLAAFKATPAYKIRRSLGFGDITDFEIGGVKYERGQPFDTSKVPDFDQPLTMKVAKTGSGPRIERRAVPRDVPSTPSIYPFEVRPQDQQKVEAALKPTTIERMKQRGMDMKLATKILYGALAESPEGKKPFMIGGHSYKVLKGGNILAEPMNVDAQGKPVFNPDGTLNVKLWAVVNPATGELSARRSITLAPKSWTSDDVISATLSTARSTPIGMSPVNGNLLFRQSIRRYGDTVVWETVTDKTGKIVAGYPAGTRPYPLDGTAGYVPYNATARDALVKSPSIAGHP